MENVIEWAKAALITAGILLAVGLAGTMDYEDRVQSLTTMQPTPGWEQAHRG